MKKLLLVFVVIGLIAFLVVGCTPTAPPGDEGEGEGEPEEVSHVVLVELFMADGCSMCEIIEPILEQLADEYSRDEMILVEEAVWRKYSTTENYDRFKWYFPNSTGTPYTALNGLNQKIIHTANYSTCKSYIDVQLSKEAKIAITATRSSTSSLTTITGNIKNISSSSISNLVINGMTFADRGETGFKYSVTDIFEEDKKEVSSLAPDESYSFSFILENINWVGNHIHGVIFVQLPNSVKKEILQAIYIE